MAGTADRETSFTSSRRCGTRVVGSSPSIFRPTGDRLGRRVNLPSAVAAVEAVLRRVPGRRGGDRALVRSAGHGARCGAWRPAAPGGVALGAGLDGGVPPALRAGAPARAAGACGNAGPHPSVCSTGRSRDDGADGGGAAALRGGRWSSTTGPTVRCRSCLPRRSAAPGPGPSCVATEGLGHRRLLADAGGDRARGPVRGGVGRDGRGAECRAGARASARRELSRPHVDGLTYGPRTRGHGPTAVIGPRGETVTRRPGARAEPAACASFQRSGEARSVAQPWCSGGTVREGGRRNG